MSARRVVKSATDWIELAKRVPVHQVSNFRAFKAKSDEYMRKVAAFPEEVPKIDWAYYKTNAANKAVIEQLEKQYNAVKIPYPNDEGAIVKIETEEKEFLQELSEFVDKSNERIQKYEKEIEAVRSAPPYDEVNQEEFAYMHPEMALDPLNRPTFWPHTEEYQLDQEDLDCLRERGFFAKGPDRYFK